MRARPRWTGVRGAAYAATLATLVAASGAAASGASAATIATAGAGKAAVGRASPPPTTVPPSGGASPGGVLADPDQDTVTPSFPAGTSPAEAARWVRAALAARAARLAALVTSVDGARDLPVAARASLSSLLATDSVGIGALTGTLGDASSLEAVEAVASSMVDGYRVFAVVTPLVRTTMAVSAQLANAASLEELEPSIEAAITTEQRGGKRTEHAQTLYGELVAALNTVVLTDQGQASALLALHVSSYPATTPVLTTAAADVATGAARLSTARAEVRQIVKLLAAPGLAAHRRLG